MYMGYSYLNIGCTYCTGGAGKCHFCHHQQCSSWTGSTGSLAFLQTVQAPFLWVLTALGIHLAVISEVRRCWGEKAERKPSSLGPIMGTSSLEPRSHGRVSLIWENKVLLGKVFFAFTVFWRFFRGRGDKIEITGGRSPRMLLF